MFMSCMYNIFGSSVAIIPLTTNSSAGINFIVFPSGSCCCCCCCCCCSYCCGCCSYCCGCCSYCCRCCGNCSSYSCIPFSASIRLMVASVILVPAVSITSP